MSSTEEEHSFETSDEEKSYKMSSTEEGNSLTISDEENLLKLNSSEENDESIVSDEDTILKDDWTPNRCKESKRLSLLAVGKTGSGKSKLGNEILGKDHFHVSSQGPLVSRKCKSKHAEVFDFDVTFIDTPGLSSLEMSDSEVQDEIGKFLLDGKNIFPIILLLIIPVLGRFTKGDKEVIDRILEIFGSRVLPNIVVVFTPSTSSQEMCGNVYDMPMWLKSFLFKIGNKFIYFKNGYGCPTDEDQVKQLLELCYDGLVKSQIEKTCYSVSDYKEVQGRLEGHRLQEVVRDKNIDAHVPLLSSTIKLKNKLKKRRKHRKMSLKR